jgi:hypothetical protein
MRRRHTSHSDVFRLLYQLNWLPGLQFDLQGGPCLFADSLLGRCFGKNRKKPMDTSCDDVDRLYAVS